MSALGAEGPSPVTGCAHCFRLERLAGGICTYWKARPLHGPQPEAVICAAATRRGLWAPNSPVCARLLTACLQPTAHTLLVAQVRLAKFCLKVFLFRDNDAEVQKEKY